MLNAWSSGVCRWRLRALNRGVIRERPGEIVLEEIWRFSACSVKMLRMGSMETEGTGKRKPGFTWKMAIKMERVCVCVCVCNKLKHAYSISK